MKYRTLKAMLRGTFHLFTIYGSFTWKIKALKQSKWETTSLDNWITSHVLHVLEVEKESTFKSRSLFEADLFGNEAWNPRSPSQGFPFMLHLDPSSHVGMDWFTRKAPISYHIFLMHLSLFLISFFQSTIHHYLISPTNGHHEAATNGHETAQE